jgi:hypothetical protein
MRPSRSSRALEAVVRDLIDTRDGATYFAERVWGISLRYDLGGGHPLVGRSASDFELADGRKLGASSSAKGKACSWTLTLGRRFGRLQAAGAAGSRMSQATSRTGMA